MDESYPYYVDLFHIMGEILAISCGAWSHSMGALRHSMCVRDPYYGSAVTYYGQTRAILCLMRGSSDPYYGIHEPYYGIRDT